MQLSTLPLLGLNALAMAVEDEDPEEDETAFLTRRVTRPRTDKSRKRRELGPDFQRFIKEAADVDEEHMVAEALFDLANMFGNNPSEEDDGGSPPSGDDEDEEETGEGEEDEAGGIKAGLRRSSARATGKRTRNGRNTASPPAERPQRMSTRRSTAQAEEGYGSGRPPRNGMRSGRGMPLNGNGTYNQSNPPGKPQPTVSDQPQQPGSGKLNDMGGEHIKLPNGISLPPGMPPPGPLGPGSMLDPSAAAALAAGGLHNPSPAQLSLLLSRTGIPPHLLGVPGMQHAAMAAAAVAAAGKVGMLPNGAQLQLPPGVPPHLLGHPGLPPWAALPGGLQALLNPALIGKSAADSALAAALLGAAHPQHAAQLAAAVTAAQLAAGVHPLPSPGSHPGGPPPAGLIPALASILPGFTPEAASLLASSPHMLQHALHAAGGNAAQLPSLLASLQQQQQAAALAQQQQQQHHHQLLLQQHQLQQQAAAAAAAQQAAAAAQQMSSAQPSGSVLMGPTVTGAVLQGSMAPPNRSVTTGLHPDASDAARQGVPLIRSPVLSGPVGGYKRCSLHVHIAHMILDATQQGRQQRGQMSEFSPVIAQPQAARGDSVAPGATPDQVAPTQQQPPAQAASTQQLLATEAPSLAGSASHPPAPLEPVVTAASVPAEEQHCQQQQQEVKQELPQEMKPPGLVEDQKRSSSATAAESQQDGQALEDKLAPAAAAAVVASVGAPSEPGPGAGEEVGIKAEARTSPPLHKDASCVAAETTAVIDVAPSGQQAALDDVAPGPPPTQPPAPVKPEGEAQPPAPGGVGPVPGLPYGLPPGLGITHLLAQGGGAPGAGLPPHVAAALRAGTGLLPGAGFPLPLHLAGLNPQQAALAAVQGLGFPLPPHLAAAVPPPGGAGHQHPLATLVNGAPPQVSAAPPPPGLANGSIPVVPSGPPPSVAGSTVTTPGPRPPSAAPPGHGVQPSLVAAMTAAAGLGGMRPEMVAALMAQNGLAGLPPHLLPRNGDVGSLAALPALIAHQQQQAAAAAAAAGMDAAKMEQLLRMHGAAALPGGGSNIAALAAMAQPPANGVHIPNGSHPLPAEAAGAGGLR